MPNFLIQSAARLSCQDAAARDATAIPYVKAKACAALPIAPRRRLRLIDCLIYLPDAAEQTVFRMSPVTV